MMMARSCPFMCSFCYHPIGRGYRHRSLDSFFSELDTYIDKYHINRIGLVDECFTFNEKKVYEFCDRIKSYNIAWGCQTRAEAFKEEIVKYMVDAGCFSALFGLESMSQRILDDMNKKITVSLLKDAMEIGYKNGAGVRGNLLFGAEAETIETIFESISWQEENTKYNIGAFSMISAYPGSTYYNHAVQRGIIQDKQEFIKNGCPEINLTNLTEKQFRMLKLLTRIKDMEIHNKGIIINLEYCPNEGYNLIGKCFHCGAVNSYHGIQKNIYQLGVIRKLGCRKCHNFSDYVLDENDRRYQKSYLTVGWIYDYLQGVPNDVLKKYIERNQIKHVGLYGVYYSSVLMDELTRLGVEVVFGVDRDFLSYQKESIPVFGLGKSLPHVDAILLMQFYFESDIKETLKDITDDKIISLEDIMEEMQDG